jgi:hypothetical protein
MNQNNTASLKPATRGKHEKQLSSIVLEDVLQKRRLEQALNVKEFAVLAGISYSTARNWLRTPGFPVFRGRVFWQDFADWRTHQNRSRRVIAQNSVRIQSEAAARTVPSGLPPRALAILLDA